MNDPFANVDNRDDDDIDLDENPNLVQVREYAKRQERRARRLERQLEELQAKLVEYERKATVGAAEQRARELGLDEQRWKALLELKPEPTPEDVERFARVVGVGESRGSEDVPKGEAEPAPSTVAAEAGGGFAPAPGTQVPTSPQAASWEEIKAAMQRGDDAFLTHVVANVARAGKALDLGPYGHLVE